MAVKVTCTDDLNTEHLVIGLNLQDIESLLRGERVTLTRGKTVTLGTNSDVAIVFGQTDQDLVQHRLPTAV